MLIKRSISGRIDKGSIGHNNRIFIASNVDETRTHQNIIIVQDDIQNVYHELFDEALAEYNARQSRKDRRIKNYYEHIDHGKQEKLFYEVLFQIGNTEDTHCGTPEAEIATKALTEFINGFQERNSHIRVFNAVIHLDEDTPHVHLDFIPFATGQKRGLSTRNSLSKALEQQGFKGEGKLNTCTKLWVYSEKEQLAAIMKKYGIEWEQLGTHEQHLDVLDYKKKMRQHEVEWLENKVECTQHELDSCQTVLNDANAVIKKLDKEFAEKSDAVEQLDNDIEENSAELENTNEQLAINQQLLQTSAEKVSRINDISSIEVKHTIIGGKVTLLTEDYEKVVDLVKKQIADDNDNAEKDDEIYRLNQLLQQVNKERALWKDERSAFQKTIDNLKWQVRELSDSLNSLKAKYNKVMQFIEKFDLKEKLDNFLHPIKKIQKHRR